MNATEANADARDGIYVLEEGTHMFLPFICCIETNTRRFMYLYITEQQQQQKKNKNIMYEREKFCLLVV